MKSGVACDDDAAARHSCADAFHPARVAGELQIGNRRRLDGEVFTEWFVPVAVKDGKLRQFQCGAVRGAFGRDAFDFERQESRGAKGEFEHGFSLNECAQVDVVRPEFAAVVAGRDLTHAGAPARRVHSRPHGVFHRFQCQTIDHDLVHRVHTLR